MSFAPEEDIEKICRLALEQSWLSFLTKPVELSVVLADDTFIQALNTEYRQKDAPTNVLSFPNYDLIPGTGDPFVQEPIIVLGDIFLSLDTLKKEAEAQQKPLKQHFFHLLLHGILHLLGYDHIDNQDAELMEALEVQLLSQLNIPNPYESV